MVQVVLFKNANFHGDHKHVVAAEPNLNAGDDHGFNDAVSSLVVLDGNWRFYADAGFKNPYPMVLGPGLYPSLSPAKIANDFDVIAAADQRTGDGEGHPLPCPCHPVQGRQLRG